MSNYYNNASSSSSNPILDSTNELESQFILRLPEVTATILQDLLKNSSSSMKDRLKIKIENDMRHGTFYLDNYALPGKIVDLPCIIESHKTIDRKNIYKTADICQMMVCTETEEPEEESKPVKKKDGVPKVDKKYLFPHGVTPPLKNVRKRRFRRTLKKKQYMDQPEIEKEVRRLLRQDYEANHVSWEVVDEEDEKARESGTKDILMQGSKTNEDPRPGDKMNVKHIFGEELSDSDLEEEENTNMGGDDEESRLTLEDEADDSLQSDSTNASYSQDTNISKRSASSAASSYITSFSGDLFSPNQGPSTSSSSAANQRRPSPEKSIKSPPGIVAQKTKPPTSTGFSGSLLSALSTEDLFERRIMLRNELNEISSRKQSKEIELSVIDNIALRQRLEPGIEKLAQEQAEKERQIRELDIILAQQNL